MSKKEKFIRIFSLSFIGLLTINYLARGIYFYGHENGFGSNGKPKAVTLYEKLIAKKNITDFGDGLNTIEEGYLYSGEVSNNYVNYAGQMWRVLSIDQEKNIVMATDKSISLLNYQGVFYDSVLRKWLEDEKNGVFNKIFVDMDKLLPQSICLDKKSEEDLKSIKDYACSVVENKGKIGILDLQQYFNTKAIKGFLNNGEVFWLANKDADDFSWFVSDQGGINTDDEKNLILGIRPTITISADVNTVSGKGTADNPYIIEQKLITYLNDAMVGDYVQIKDELWRIVTKGDNKVKIVKDGYLSDTLYKYDSSGLGNYAIKNSKNIGYYLNNEYLKSFDKIEIVSGPWYNGTFTQSNIYDYLSIAKRKVTASAGLLNIGDLYVGEFSNVFTATQEYNYKNLNTIYTITEDGHVFIDLPSSKYLIRPAIYIAGTTVVLDGIGLESAPYIIGGLDE